MNDIFISSNSTKIAVYFDEPFWVGMIERQCGKSYQVCKVVFGAEPKDNEVYLYLLKNYNRLRFSSSVKVDNCQVKKANPKRVQKEIRKQLSSPVKATKAWETLKQYQEQNKLVRKSVSKDEREKEKQHRFLLSQEKRKEKHRGH